MSSMAYSRSKGGRTTITNSGRLQMILAAIMLASMPWSAHGTRMLKQFEPVFASFDTVDFVGCNGPNIMRPLRVIDRRACQDLCKAAQLCQAYSFAISSRTCYLKAEPCVGTNIDANPNNLSGMRKPSVPLDSTVAKTTGTPASDSPVANDGLAEIDAEEEESLELVVSATQAPSPTMNDQPLLISGGMPVSATMSTPPTVSTLPDDPPVTISVMPIDTTIMTSPNAAPNQPNTIPSIMPTESPQKPGAINSLGIDNVGQTVPAVQFFRLPPGVGCKGMSITSQRVLDVLQCERMCGQFEDCMAYSFNTGSGQCFLKGDTCTLNRQDNSATNNISGIKRHDPVTASGAVHLSVNERYFTPLDYIGCNGPTLSTVDTPDRSECETLCRENAMCMAYSFAISSGRCYLKAEVCDTTNQDVNRNNISGTIIEPTLGQK